jgi:hypothetical protein
LLSFGALAADKYALVAAMGNRFSAVHEVHTIGSRLPNFPKRALEVKGDGINKLALASLDRRSRRCTRTPSGSTSRWRLRRASRIACVRIEQNAFDDAPSRPFARGRTDRRGTASCS